MADYNSSLPIRTEVDPDSKVHVKIVDATTPSQQAIVDTDGNVHIEMHGDDPAGLDKVVRLSEAGALTPDGVYDAALNTKPGNVGLIASSRAAAPDDTTQTERLTSVVDGGGTVRALDVSIHDEDGEPFSSTNPMPVVVVESEGSEINDYKAAAAIAAAGTDNHDYTVTAATTLMLTQIEGAASGRAKMVVSIETAAGSNTFVPKFAKFNSTSDTNFSIILKEPIAVAAGVRVRVAMTNREVLSAQDLYSTISGHEV